MSVTEHGQNLPADDGPQVSVRPSNLFEGARSVWALAQRGAGAVFVLAALGLWVLPGAWSDTDALLKLAVSLTLGFSGLAMWQLGGKSHKLEIELDTETYEFSLSVMLMGKSIPLLTCNLTDLDHVEHRGSSLRFWNTQGQMIAEVEMWQDELRDRLPDVLHEAGLLQAGGRAPMRAGQHT